MQSIDLIELLKRSEGKTLEFKQALPANTDHKGLARTLCAFANTAGGYILFGIEDKTKHIIGVPDPYMLEEKIANIIDTLITPKIIPDIEIFPYETRSILAVRIYPNSTTRPYFLKEKDLEKAYIRVGSSNRLADPQTIQELRRLGQNSTSLSFEEQPFTTLDAQAIDVEAVTRFFRSVTQIKMTDAFLSSLKLITDFQGKYVPTNAGMILFGRERESYFPNAKIKAVRFSGVVKGLKTLDSREIDSYPVDAVQEAMDFVQKHANYESEINTSSQADQWSVQRIDRWNIPIAAVREAIINAVVHADYAQKGSDIHLFIYQDRIEIENPGLLVFGLSIEDITKGISKLRNPIIGRVFNKLGFMEQYGSGIHKIIQECQRFGLETPKFEELATHFRVIIYTSPQKTPTLDEQDNIIIDVLRYQYFSNRSEGLSTKEICSRTMLAQRSTRIHLSSLVQSGFVAEIGTSATDPKKKYFLREEYARLLIFIPDNNKRREMADVLNSGILSSEKKIESIEKMLGMPAQPAPPEWKETVDLVQRFSWRNVNAFASAFGLADIKAYRDTVPRGDGSPYDFASPTFAMDYIKERNIKELEYPDKNGLVLYFDKNENPVHAGSVQETLFVTVQSKWGTFPALFKHTLRDVPSFYGSIVKFYPPIDGKDAYAFFKEWSKIGLQ